MQHTETATIKDSWLEQYAEVTPIFSKQNEVLSHILRKIDSPKQSEKG